MNIKTIMVKNMLKAFNTLGIEGTLEVIESLKAPILRVRLRQCYYELITKNNHV